MKASHNWNYERWRTRDRLIGYYSIIIPLRPRNEDVVIPYPWKNDTSPRQLQTNEKEEKI